MRFDISNNSNNSNNTGNSNRPPRKKKFNTTYVAIGIFVVVFIIILIIFGNSLFNKPTTETPIEPTIDTSSRISKMLYKKVHDFDNRNPFWMYSEDDFGLVSEMKESTKMALVYINLRYNDFKKVKCTSLPEDAKYDNYECKDSTLIVYKDDVESTYKDLFGDNSRLSSTATMKADKSGNQVYHYNDEIDAYILFNRVEQIKANYTSLFKYELTKVEKNGDKLLLYEVISEKDLTTKKITKTKYVYTFMIDSDGLYNYYSMERE